MDDDFPRQIRKIDAVWREKDRPDDINQLLDDLKSRMGCEFTVFEGNTRAYTTVVQNGKRAVGTTLSAELSEIVLQKGQSYVGEGQIPGGNGIQRRSNLADVGPETMDRFLKYVGQLPNLVIRLDGDGALPAAPTARSL